MRASAVRRIGRFQLEAAVQSAHAARRLTGKTDWTAIVALYNSLLAQTGSPVVAINRAAAIGELHGAVAGLLALDGLAEDRRLMDTSGTGRHAPTFWHVPARLMAPTEPSSARSVSSPTQRFAASSNDDARIAGHARGYQINSKHHGLREQPA